MKPYRPEVAVILLLLIATMYAAGQEKELPRLTHRVTDMTGTLDGSQAAALEAKLAEFERTTSTQIVVVMLADLEGGSIEDISIRLAEKNLIGQKAKDNGVLLLIVKNDRQMRIEVGYGLEGVLTDALSGQIIRNEIAPHFARGDYYDGIDAGIEAIMKATRNEYQSAWRGERKSRVVNPFVVVFLILLFALLRRRRRGRGPFFYGGPWGTGGFGGGFGGGFSGGGGSFGGGGASGRW